MRYVMLIAGDASLTMPEEEQAAVYEKIGAWFADLGAKGKIVGGEELQGADTATTVRLNGGKTLVTDGPFVETKEIIGGFAILECADLDEALAIAKSWPSPHSVLEVRPVVDHSS
ncbi:MAG TPA: YciI family protein [Actinomycetota bacterium]|jgi:hypothetical protein|nr:YciI family protein [Actinomycetota bacterium]